MSAPFVAEIRIFACNFAPTGWAQCNGQIMPISQNTALFSLLGTYYGGDGKSTFALPNLMDSVPVHTGQGQGLSQRFLGEQSGAEFVTLLESEIPAHNHALNAMTLAAVAKLPAANTSIARSRNTSAYAVTGTLAAMNPSTLAPTGGSLPHNNLMPYLVLNFCIALQGVFPPRT